MKLWKQLVALFFVLLLVDGAVRKWVAPSLATPLFVVKDAVLWGGYLLYAWNRNPFKLPRPLRGTWVSIMLGAYVFVVLLQAFNIRQPSFIVSALGLKYHLAFVPLVVLVPALIADASEETFTRLLWGYALCIYLPVIALGVYQFFQPPTAWINRYIGGTEAVAKVGGRPRITATFSYIGSFTPYLEFSTFLSASTLLAGLRWDQKWLKVLGGVLTAATVIVLPMTGSRSVIYVPAVVLLGLLLVMRTKGQWFKLFGVAVFSLFLLVTVSGDWALQGWSAFEDRLERAGTGANRIELVFMTPIDGLERAGLFGYGVGTNAKPAARLTGRSDWPGRYLVDRPGLRLIMEIGILGWMVLVALKLALLYTSFRALRASRSSMAFIISATAFCMIFANLARPAVFNVVDSGLLWGSVGAVLGIWSRQQVRERATALRTGAG